MRQSLNEGQLGLTKLLKDMGEEVGRILKGCMETLLSLDRTQANFWITEDQKVNDFERQVDDLCVLLIATQQPVAKDLRKIISAMKISTDLERMADLAIDIAKIVRRIDGPLCKPLVDIPQMAEMALGMMRQGLEAYASENMELAHELAELDDQVDRLYKKVVRDLLVIMTEATENLDQGMYLIFVGRYLERFADHATNIGENVIYIATASRQDLNK
ncbi:phosphate signaling complex protein PhoU [Desulfosporosinus sp. BICA1-9]|uniref:phosphate signaling complex protein PhoU n=1 Tax=Desulfosporosinus sp. BICA1-9 TaxID=1531958 RepID=UPI00054B0D95|nr:phosphate signaling complex protein PhoU [Desulfosporosinus sp. BICA1-9]KJS49606.1 MAG: PhoU family transcriptional regulator [Peptococcaceae bacterium BRH_c23]KJS77888.1 MAG: PhoU family transcriptional regulator [Desulfosporosinus sp. BICA1-9]HBW34592.1 phosphate transport system regulatory protein PhoU [Desulfosporosinus sp.]